MNNEPLRTIEREVASWPGVSTGGTGRGGLQLNYGKVELGHLHGSSFADLPFPKRIRDRLIAEGRASVHPPLPDSGWVRRKMDGPGDAEAVIELLRMNYERARGPVPNGARHPSLPGDDLLRIEPKKNTTTITDHRERTEQWLTNFPTFPMTMTP